MKWILWASVSVSVSSLSFSLLDTAGRVTSCVLFLAPFLLDCITGADTASRQTRCVLRGEKCIFSAFYSFSPKINVQIYFLCVILVIHVK